MFQDFWSGLTLTEKNASIVSGRLKALACVAGFRKGRGRELGRETTREGGGERVFLPPSSRAPRVSLAPKTPFPKTPFPFSFKRLPRRLLKRRLTLTGLVSLRGVNYRFWSD